MILNTAKPKHWDTIRNVESQFNTIINRKQALSAIQPDHNTTNLPFKVTLSMCPFNNQEILRKVTDRNSCLEKKNRGTFLFSV